MPPHSSSPVALRLGHDAALDRYEAAWRALAHDVGTATFFMLPSSFRAWRDVLSAQVETSVIVVVEGTDLIGVLPVMRARVMRGPAFVPRIDYGPADRVFSPGGSRLFPIRQLSPVVSWQATSVRPTLLCHPERQSAVTAAIAPLLAGASGVDQIVLPARQDGEETDWQTALSDAGLAPWVHQLGRQVLTIERARPFDEIVAGEKKKFRQNVRRARAAGEAAGLRFSTHAGREAVLPRMDAFAALAAESWKQAPETGGTIAIPYQGPQRRFFETLLAVEDTGFVPVLSLAETDAGPVAALLSAHHGSTLTMLLTFRDGQFPRASPGLLTVATAIDWAASQGIARIDLNSTQSWVRYIADSRHMLCNVAAFRPTPRGQVYGGLRRLAARLRKQPTRPEDA